MQTVSSEIVVAFAYDNMRKRSSETYGSESSLFNNSSYGIFFDRMAHIVKMMEIVQTSHKKV